MEIQTYNERILDALSRAVEDVYKNPLSCYLVSARDRVLSDVRHQCMFILREETRLTYMSIGKMLNRHHATIIYGVEQARQLMQIDRAFKHNYKELLKTFKNYYK